MKPDELTVVIRMSASALSDEEILHRVRETVDVKLRSGGLTTLAMRPSRGYLSLVSRALLHPRALPVSHYFSFPYARSPFL